MKGFTLIEALITFSLFVLILSGILYTLTIGRQTQEIAIQKLYLLNKLTSLSLMLSRELRETGYLHITDSQGNSLNSDTLYKSIKFSLPQIDSQGQKTWSSDYIEYNFTTTRFLKKDSSQETIFLDEVEFSSDTGFIYRSVENKLEVIINCTKTLSSGRKVFQNLRWGVVFRNR